MMTPAVSLSLGLLVGAAAASTAPAAALVRSELSSGAGDGITWSLKECCYPAGAAAGSAAHFSVTWGVDAQSASPAAAAILSGSFWFGGRVLNVSIGAPGNCSLTPATQQLVCQLGAIAVGAFGPTLDFDVSVLSEETSPHYLPYFLAGLNGFENGPETFGRVEVE